MEEILTWNRECAEGDDPDDDLCEAEGEVRLDLEQRDKMHNH